MKSSKPIRILVVDDHFMVRMGLSASLNVEPDMEVVAEAGNGQIALEAYRKHRPNLVMMDLRLPGANGTDALIAILGEFLARVHTGPRPHLIFEAQFFQLSKPRVAEIEQADASSKSCK